MSRATTRDYKSDPLEPLLSIRQLATVLGTSRESIYRLMRSGEIVPVRVGARARFTHDDVRDYIERNREPQGGSK